MCCKAHKGGASRKLRIFRLGTDLFGPQAGQIHEKWDRSWGKVFVKQRATIALIGARKVSAVECTGVLHALYTHTSYSTLVGKGSERIAG